MSSAEIEVDIVINLNKPRDITSHDAVLKVKKILKAKKAGHAGSLDPIATGVLLVCAGRATRLTSYFTSLDKEYYSVLKLGEITDTQDAYGKVIEKRDVIRISRDLMKRVLNSFEGRILQQPPMYSALKHKGKPLYKLARKGIIIERPPREVHIRNIELLDIDHPYVRFKTVCSRGTYIRTLCHDIGEQLGTGAHLFGLERTAIGPFELRNSVTIAELRSMNGDIYARPGIYSIDRALSWMPELTVNELLVTKVKNGASIQIHDCTGFTDELRVSAGIKIKSPQNELIAIASYSPAKDIIKMDVVFA